MNFRQSKDIVSLWQSLQSLEWKHYLERGGKDVFSIPGHKNAAKLKKIIESDFQENVSTLGGCLAKPSYMADGKDEYNH